ncbi:hypothetical protein NPIL_316521 [Nephila pilipes]|uniref:Uncharacterized protein n=1 Tax=Nephila pilipes TaxID=299642 RepID=A0A8X6QID1_NEPPI|nr:hypothetical protein NPIL_316521 [Nephila pilipes]
MHGVPEHRVENLEERNTVSLSTTIICKSLIEIYGWRWYFEILWKLDPSQQRCRMLGGRANSTNTHTRKGISQAMYRNPGTRVHILVAATGKSRSTVWRILQCEALQTFHLQRVQLLQ